jgi:phosphonatase-like hydrolase
MKPIDLVVFDMAGTTIKDSGQVMAAFTAALASCRIAVTESQLRSWRGASKRAVLRHFVEQQFGSDDPDNVARVDRTYAVFCQRLESSYTSDGATAIPGVEATFNWLVERDVKIALTTGFYRKVTDIILDAVGWNHGAIDTSVCSDEVPQGRPAPFMIFRAMEATGVTDVRRVIKVGDTALDLLAGTNAGVGVVVGVLSGSQTVVQLASVEHTHILTSVGDLPRLLTPLLANEAIDIGNA